MNKQIVINYLGKDYALEFTRKSVSMMEQNGFVASDIDKTPVTTLPKLFAGSFLANHRFTDKKIIDDIFNRITDRKELIGKLAEMYSETVTSLMDEPEENEGNVSWTASW